jgi:hypothetical protein
MTAEHAAAVATLRTARHTQFLATVVAVLLIISIALGVIAAIGVFGSDSSSTTQNTFCIQNPSIC